MRFVVFVALADCTAHDVGMGGGGVVAERVGELLRYEISRSAQR